MSTWYNKEMGDGIDAKEPSNKLLDMFKSMAVTGGVSPRTAVFSRYDLEKNLVTWYFSPETSILANIFEATQCDKPTPTKGFGLLVGDASSLKTHFPNYVVNR